MIKRPFPCPLRPAGATQESGATMSPLQPCLLPVIATKVDGCSNQPHSIRFAERLTSCTPAVIGHAESWIPCLHEPRHNGVVLRACSCPGCTGVIVLKEELHVTERGAQPSRKGLAGPGCGSQGLSDSRISRWIQAQRSIRPSSEMLPL